MLKIIISSLSLLMLNVSLLFGSINNPMRDKNLDYTSQSATIKLTRGENILSTLVPDPQNYHLILSAQPTFGGAAVPPNVYSDKPVIILFQGALAPARSDEEIAFMMAHEIGHLQMYHNERMSERMDQIFNGPPAGLSGKIFSIFYQKIEERDADLFGLDLFKKAGYNLEFFPHTLNLIKINPNIHFGSTRVFAKALPSLSMKNSHFSILERFELLTQESTNSSV